MAFSSTTKYNYIDIVNRLVPEFYRETDFRLYGEEEDVSLTFLGKILKAAIQNDLYFTVSSADLTTRLETSALAQYFVPNQQTHISPNEFQRRILNPYQLTFDSFQTQEELTTWFSGTFLPDAVCNNPSGLLAEMSGIAFGSYSSLSSVHNYLTESLGLFYFMNTSALSGATASGDASAVMIEYLIPPLFRGETVTTKNGLNSLFRFFWEGRDDSTYYSSFFPFSHASSTATLSSMPYLSGTQMFTAIQKQLETWTDDRLKNSKFFKDSLSILLGPDGYFPTKMRDAGPFQRFLKAISLGIADINLIIEEIGDLLSIDDCPDKFLELLANNIGWQFLTGDFDKWRAQLRNAVMVYKTKGSVVGFDAACKLVFPDGVFSASDVGETWESYIPKLLYYLVKTESFIAKEGASFKTQDELFNGSFPSALTFNQASPGMEDAEDRNYRFLVDAIIEQFDNNFSAIRIGGKHFKEDKLWECIPETPKKGFWHRNYPNDIPMEESGFYVSVPPWEKYGFYKETQLNPTRVDFLCRQLSGSRNEFGFEVNQGYVQGFKTMLLTAIEKIYALSGTPSYGDNNKFRLFTSGHELPPNYSKFVEYGHTSALNLFDEWNTKSSFIFGAFAASSLDYTVARYDSFRNKAALNVYADILRTFLPLHVVARITLYEDLEDTHSPWSKLCILSDECLDTFNTEYLRSYRTDFWAGASGTGALGFTAVNGDGRVLPYWSDAGDDPNSFFFVSATDLDRNTSRRRNYRYALPCYPYTRPGKGQPIAMNHFGIAESDAPMNEYTNTWEYIPKGFRYDTQDYLPVSSGVWDNSGYFSGTNCSLTGLDSGDVSLSSVYPTRAVPDTNTACSSVLIHRDSMKGIMRPMTSRTIRHNSNPQFSDLDYRSFEFGTSVHKGYHIYKNEFSSLLANTLSPNVPFYGGYNFISYAYGPTLWNSDFRYKGLIDANTSSTTFATPLPEGGYPGGYEAQWSSVIGGGQSSGLKYHSYNNALNTISNRPYFTNAPDASTVYAPSGVYRTSDRLVTNEILSGIQLRSHLNSPCFAVVNNSNTLVPLNSTLGTSVTLFSPDSRSVEVVVPFDPQYAGETRFNKLRPQSQFSVNISAKTQRNLEAQRLSVELSTSGVVADDGEVTEWRFCWRDRKWISARHEGETPSPLDDHEFTKILPVSTTARCPEVLSAQFHTQDIFTDKEIPCGTVFKSGDVHTSSTGYLLKVTTNSQNVVLNDTLKDGLVLYEISVVDKVLNQAMNHFNSKEIDTIYTFWDGLTTTSYSRDAVYSASSFEVSGGSKAEYVELLGGATNSGATTQGSFTFLSFNLDD